VTATHTRSPYLLRVGLVRNTRTAEHLTTFVIAGVATVLIIDEVGKFVTADNDYFYRPTAAIVYVVFVLIVLGAKFVTGRRPIDPREQLANVVDHAVEGVAGGLSQRRREQATAQLQKVGPEVPGRAETAALVAACPPDEVELPAPVDAGWHALQRGFDHLATHRLAPRITVTVLVLQAIGAPLIATGIRFDDGRAPTDPPVLGVLAGSLLAASFTARGWVRLRRHGRERAVRLFELAVLVSLLVTQVFQFAATQFAAVGGMTLDLILLGLLGAEQDRLRRKAAAARTGLPDHPRFPRDPADPA
jgi:hypothetical protein